MAPAPAPSLQILDLAGPTGPAPGVRPLLPAVPHSPGPREKPTLCPLPRARRAREEPGPLPSEAAWPRSRGVSSRRPAPRAPARPVYARRHGNATRPVRGVAGAAQGGGGRTWGGSGRGRGGKRGGAPDTPWRIAAHSSALKHPGACRSGIPRPISQMGRRRLRGHRNSPQFSNEEGADWRVVPSYSPLL